MTEWLMLVGIFAFGIIAFYILQLSKAPNRYALKNIQYTEIKLIRKLLSYIYLGRRLNSE